ncbi:hypothetical protein SBV1_370115 [Verrucomicrobia bacterium]|nr:hypothetical protein SBV1_370115 [Verrucomicrobiota bacterium]
MVDVIAGGEAETGRTSEPQGQDEPGQEQLGQFHLPDQPKGYRAARQGHGDACRDAEQAGGVARSVWPRLVAEPAGTVSPSLLVSVLVAQVLLLNCGKLAERLPLVVQDPPEHLVPFIGLDGGLEILDEGPTIGPHLRA